MCLANSTRYIASTEMIAIEPARCCDAACAKAERSSHDARFDAGCAAENVSGMRLQSGACLVANIFAFEGIVPVVHESAFVHPNATVTGT